MPEPFPEELPIIRKLSAAEARSLVGGLLDGPVKEAVEMPAFAGNQVFRIERDTLVSFLKLAADADLRREVAVLNVLGRVGVPVPLIQAADPSGELAGVACVLLRQVDGEPVDCASPEFGLAGRALRQVHEVMLAGYGSLVDSSEGLCGEDQSWADTISGRMAGLGLIAETGLVDAGLLDQTGAAVRALSDVFANVAGGHLLHGDFNPRHVYARGGHITGIIDWSDAVCGDPVYDLGRVFHSAVLEADDIKYGLDVVKRLLKTYGDAPWLAEGLTESLLVYAAVFIVWSMQGELAGGAPWPPWWPIQSRALARIVDAL